MELTTLHLFLYGLFALGLALGVFCAFGSKMYGYAYISFFIGSYAFACTFGLPRWGHLIAWGIFVIGGLIVTLALMVHDTYADDKQLKEAQSLSF